MRHIQDKDLDKLFQETFAEAEFTPSAALWQNIEKRIEGKKKRSFPVFWTAAASILVVLTATLLLNKEEKIQLHGQEISIITPEEPVTAPLVQEEPPALIQRVSDQKTANVTTKAPLKAVQTPAPVEQQVITATEPVAETTYAAVVTPPSVPNNAFTNKEVKIEPQSQEVVYAQLDPASSATETADQAAAKGIRNVGDLVNFVVNKVDGRDKKLIRFKTDDEGSSLIGINIGFLKFNSRKNK